MTALPPNMVGSVLQSHLAQHQVSVARETEESQRDNASRRQASAADERDTTVGTTDTDTQIHSDAEGTGSQGRAFNSPEEEVEQDADELPPPQGDEGRNLDLTA
jgi:type IV secretory pathway TrbL component